MKKLLFLIFLIPCICFSQQQDIHAFFTTVYNQESLAKTNDHFKLHFINTEDLLIGEHGEINQIMLIRHQKVDIEKKLLYNYKNLQKYRSAYDTEDIHPVNQKKILFTEGVDTIYTSDLHRAKATAAKLLGDSYTYESKHFFNELKPGSVNIPLLYLPKPIWSGLNRIFWMFGSKPKANSEDRSMAQKRVNQAADFLVKKSLENKKVILVAHGYMNHMLRKRLKKLGWMIVTHSGNENLGGSLLVKIDK